MIGSFGDIVFTASERQVRTFRGMTKDASVRIAQHEVIQNKQSVEFIGSNLNKISFNMDFSVSLGTNPAKEIEKLESVMHAGEYRALLIGSRVMGDYLIESVSQSFGEIYRDGFLLSATVTVSLLEYNQ